MRQFFLCPWSFAQFQPTTRLTIKQRKVVINAAQNKQPSCKIHSLARAALVRRRAPCGWEKEIKAEKREDPQSALPLLLLKLNLDKPASLLLWKHYFFSSPGAVTVGSFASLYRNYVPLVFFFLSLRVLPSLKVFFFAFALSTKIFNWNIFAAAPRFRLKFGLAPGKNERKYVAEIKEWSHCYKDM
jgi:hypothetical protein